jgi:3',5'-nucleoside bisphosphate phosphatase
MSKCEVDMHMHTSISDGSDDPEVIPWKAKRAGLRGICLTDHDCHLGLPAFMEAASQYGLDTIAGIEISTKYRGVDVHILGYGIDFSKDAFLCSRLEKYWEMNKRRSEKALEQYIQAGFLPKNTTLEKIKAITGSRGPWVSLMHIRAYRAKLLGLSYRESIRDIGRGGVAYVRWDNSVLMTPEEVIDFIEMSGGFPVLAHPEEFMRRTDGAAEEAAASLFEVLDMFQGRKRKGLEAHHPSHSLERRHYYHELARKRGFIVTAGSDFHGDFKPNVPLGMHGITHKEFLDFKRLCGA